MLASVSSATVCGVDGQVVTVEVHVSAGLPGYHVVGLPDAAVRESRERVRAALLSSELTWPLKRVTVNLAPGGFRKTGSGLELAVALGLLVAHGELPAGALDNVGVVGELGLDGTVRAVPGTLALADALARAGIGTVVVPRANALEAKLVAGLQVRVANDLCQLRECLKGEAAWPDPPPPDDEAGDDPLDDEPLDLAEVRGLAWARRALEVAAAGAHNLLFAGPPGAGKTMLARRLASILPPLSTEEALEVTRIHSVAGRGVRGTLVRRPPFRAPHHTATVAALVGGGSRQPQPGEVTIAHRGALFLDELGEFPPRALEALRQPLEERVVRIARQSMTLAFPSDVLLIACTNPCPCGLGAPACTCSEGERARYRRRLSSPLLDRFDLRLLVRPPENNDREGESSADVRARVLGAVERQRSRYAGTSWRRNAHVPAGALELYVRLDTEARAAWRAQIEECGLTGRGATRIRRVARTLADLDDMVEITAGHVVVAALLREDVP